MVDIGVVVDVSKMFVQVNAVVDIEVVGASSKVTVVDPPGMIEQTRARPNISSKVPRAIVGCSPQLLLYSSSNQSPALLKASKPHRLWRLQLLHL